MADFIAMGGYAQFVWSAFGIWFACVIFNIVSARRKIRVSLEQAAVAAARHRHRQSRKNKQSKLRADNEA
jgi:heme exporter protein CcmD